MAITGSLQLGAAGDGGSSWRIINMTYEFSQRVDNYGRPNATPDGGFINLTVESSSSDITVIQWMLSNHTMTDGGAFFFDRNGRQVRAVEFKGAYCIYFKETFDAFNDAFMRIDFRISCREITIDGGGAETTMIKPWPNSGTSSGAGGGGEASNPPASSSSSSDGIGSFNPND